VLGSLSTPCDVALGLLPASSDIAPRSPGATPLGHSARIKRAAEIEAREGRDVSPDELQAWLDAKDPTAAFRNDRDPELSADGVRAEVEDALLVAGLIPDDLEHAFVAGRPPAWRVALRERYRMALSPIYEDGRRRDYMAATLCISRQALDGLMKPLRPPKRRKPRKP
jgi:hypothetical protein